MELFGQDRHLVPADMFRKVFAEHAKHAVPAVMFMYVPAVHARHDLLPFVAL